MILNNIHVSGNNLRKFYPLYMLRSRHLVLRTQACLLSPNRAASQACQPCSCRIRVKEPSFRQATRSFEPSHINIQSDADQVYPFSDTQQRQLKAPNGQGELLSKGTLPFKSSSHLSMLFHLRTWDSVRQSSAATSINFISPPLSSHISLALSLFGLRALAIWSTSSPPLIG